MRLASIAVSVLVVSFVLAQTVLAGPAADIRKPPVTTMNGFPTDTGPTGIDPGAKYGQWFKNENGARAASPYEFYDNVTGTGGGSASSDAIKGIVKNVAGGVLGTPITSFDIDVTITNDLPGVGGEAANGANSHGEQLTSSWLTEEMVMEGVRLTGEFAIAAGIAPSSSGGPYRQTNPYIITSGYDELAWYCYAENNPFGGQGDFSVPTWNFGDIAPSASVTRTLSFTVDGNGLEVGDSRYDAIVNAMIDDKDILFNRTTSLKISSWVDDLAVDDGSPYPLGALESSDVSVFFGHQVPEPSTIVMLGGFGLCLAGYFARRRRAG